MIPELLGVVVPARDEAGVLPACLAALAVAAADPELAGVAVRVVVVAHRCTDATAAVAAAAGAVVVEAHGETVGDARHAGSLAVLAEAAAAGVPPHRVWLASTDADSVVPAGWLALQRAAAESGWTPSSGWCRSGTGPATRRTSPRPSRRSTTGGAPTAPARCTRTCTGPTWVFGAMRTWPSAASRRWRSPRTPPWSVPWPWPAAPCCGRRRPRW
ncbi:hypothetical protein ACFQX8_05235 [Klenkia terrae]|uniref:hypothetical protein n=1 Tax=Klenkia terrae TaxID=1052259 RepID=UPI00360FA32C